MVCSTISIDTIYNGTDGIIQYVLLNDDEPVIDLSSVNKVTIQIGGSLIDSSISVGAIWWTDTYVYFGQVVNVIKLKLGGEGLVAGEYLDCRLIVYDPANINGIVWSDSIKITVED